MVILKKNIYFEEQISFYASEFVKLTMITPYIRILDSDWLIASLFKTYFFLPCRWWSYRRSYTRCHQMHRSQRNVPKKTLYDYWRISKKISKCWRVYTSARADPDTVKRMVLGHYLPFFGLILQMNMTIFLIKRERANPYGLATVSGFQSFVLCCLCLCVGGRGCFLCINLFLRRIERCRWL